MMAYTKDQQVRSNKPKKNKPKKKKVKTPLPQGEHICFACGRNKYLEIHHCYGGSSRNNSSLHNCVEWLCHHHHRGNEGVHSGNAELDLKLKQKHQLRLMESGMTEEKFIYLFGRNYL